MGLRAAPQQTTPRKAAPPAELEEEAPEGELEEETPEDELDEEEAEATPQSATVTVGAGGETATHANTLAGAMAKVDAGGTIQVKDNSLVLSATVTVDKSVTITSAGGPFTIKQTSFATDTPMLNVTGSATLTLQNIVLDGSGSIYGGILSVGASAGLRLGSGAVLKNKSRYPFSTGAATYGGAVYSEGQITMLAGSKIENCKVLTTGYNITGGGIAATAGTVSLQGGTIIGCESDYGGGVYLSGNASLTMTAGLIDGCSAFRGGGICKTDISGKISIEGGTIQNCKAANAGGAVYTSYAPLSMSDGLIKACVSSNGGGIYAPCNVTLSGGTISGCTGGSVQVASYGASTLIISGGVIENGDEGIMAHGSCEITGGTIRNMDTGLRLVGDSAVISGGTITGCKEYGINWISGTLALSGSVRVGVNANDNKLYMGDNGSKTPINVAGAFTSGANINLEGAYSLPRYKDDIFVVPGPGHTLHAADLAVFRFPVGYSAELKNNYAVLRMRIDSFTLEKSVLQLYSYGSTYSLGYTLKPAGTDVIIDWTSSNNSVVNVSGEELHPYQIGTATITATIVGTNISASCVVHVVPEPPPPPDPTDIKLNKSNHTMVIGDKLQLTATVTPAEAAQAQVTWTTTDANVLTVDKNGLVTAVAPGHTYITATAGWVIANCPITVYAPTTSVKMAQTSLRMAPGKKSTARAEAYLSDGTTTSSGLTWASSNTKVATVSQGGKITAAKNLKKKTSATITATTIDGKSASMKVTVLKKGSKTVKVTKMALSKPPKKMEVGATKQLKAKISPSNATGAAMSWSSKKPSVLEVDIAGKLTAKKEGSAKITVKAGDKSASITVKVVAPTKKVTLEQKGQAVSGTLKLKRKKSATVTPKALNAAGQVVSTTFTWKSPKPTVATVSKKGKIKAKKKGTTTITVKAANGKSAKFKVKVT